MRLDQLLDATTRARVPALVWGPPGVGKTAAIRRWAARRKLQCWTVIASLREPSDFGGLPIVDASSATAAWKVLARAAEAGGADVAAAAARDLARARTTELDAPVRELRHFFPILEAAGLLPSSAVAA